MGPLIPIAKYFEISKVFAASFTFIIFFLILINYIYKLFPIIEDVERKSYGTLFYCLSLFLLIIIFWNEDPNSLIAGFFIMTFGDGFAGLIGKNFSSKSWQIINQKKSLLGTITMFLTSSLVLISVSSWGGLQLNSNYLLIALIATILEQISIFGIDNFTVPIFSSLSFNLFITNLQLT
tara:strand:+ start:16361 stop:16897 length:537 start_codon:yes stop_codon:yes gene_type:complete